jgi:hypothetical protein|tara:strand:- start:26310 stop:27410 length:1101 start_codon:yes stop_codon:yes gene_type:complete
MVLRGQSELLGPEGETRERWDKTRQEGRDPGEVVQLPDPKTITKLATHYDAEGSVTQQWVAEKPELKAREAAWRAVAEELKKDIVRVEPAPAPSGVHPDNELLAGYPVGDHHVGMFSWVRETGGNYDTQIAENLLRGATDHLVRAVGPCGSALVAFLGDFLHYDSFEAITPTSRNTLDSDTRFPKMVQAAVRMMRYSVDAALRAHRRVKVIVEIGNHDLSSSVFLAECLRIAYENEPRVMVDTSPKHYHYHRHGNVLIGTHHGHGTHMKNLPLTMAADQRQHWGETEHRHWWTGHVHHGKTQPAISAQDYSGCTVESFRVLPPADAWAHQKGYRPIRGMQAIVYHSEHGEVARHTVHPNMMEENDG